MKPEIEPKAMSRARMPRNWNHEAVRLDRIVKLRKVASNNEACSRKPRWFAFAQLPEKEFAAQAKDLAAKFYNNEDKTKPIKPIITGHRNIISFF